MRLIIGYYLQILLISLQWTVEENKSENYTEED